VLILPARIAAAVDRLGPIAAAEAGFFGG